MKASSKTNEQGLWKAHSSAWKASGLTQRAYCEQEDISYNSFVYQHNRLMEQQSKKAPLNFVEAKPAAVISIQATGLQLCFPMVFALVLVLKLIPNYCKRF